MGQSLSKNFVHIIFGTKNLFPFIKPPVETELYSYIGGICSGIECITPLQGLSNLVYPMGCAHRFNISPLRG
ncbi:MAG TPA: hypothetical protein PKE39_08110 [Ignavibacteria bacterium]|nr:hypothetical protein [Ignavibacteria bacterium]HMQ98973.1 hypothetical protein [Ignavibacteria bacterium]